VLQLNDTEEDVEAVDALNLKDQKQARVFYKSNLL